MQSYNQRVPRFTGKAIGTIVSAVFLGILALTVMGGSFYQVEQTERAVLLRNGAFVGIEEPGLHFKAPFFDTVVHISNIQRTSRWDRSGDYDYRQQAYTYDQQPAHLSLTVMWHIPTGAVDNVYRRYKDAEGIESNLLNRRIPQAVKTVIGNFTAVRAIQERAKLNAEVLAAVKTDPEIVDAPVEIDGVQVEDIELSKTYIDSVEAAMQARVEVQRRQQQEEQQKITANIAVIDAKGKAEARVAEANAEATATRVRGEAEAAAIKAKGDALRENPQLVDLTRAEKWNGILPTTMLPNGTVPFLNVGK